MKKFLNVAFKSQWKTILIIAVLIIIQTIFQMEIIDLFSVALTGVKNQEIDLLFKSGLYMLIFTVLSMICMYAVSRLSVRVSSNATFNIREKIFHILMNLPDEEISKFKLTALYYLVNKINVHRTGIYSDDTRTVNADSIYVHSNSI